ncbi:MAG: hypothetical protein E6089_00260 [Enterobacter sp.]|nr:hypothetical protein [Pseudescherichia vulneris]MDU5512491.1 hypothetical protein [Enterobacter sp.]
MDMVTCKKKAKLKHLKTKISQLQTQPYKDGKALESSQFSRQAMIAQTDKLRDGHSALWCISSLRLCKAKQTKQSFANPQNGLNKKQFLLSNPDLNLSDSTRPARRCSYLGFF